MDKLIFWIIIIVAYCFIVLSIVLGFKNLKSKHAIAYKILLALMIVSLTSDVVSLLFIYAMQANSFPVLHTYTVLEYTLLALLYRSVFQNRFFKKATVFSTVAFFVFKAIDLLFITSIREADTIAIIIESIVMITFSMLYFGQLITKEGIKLAKFPMFYINTATLFYFSGSFLLFLYGTYIFEEANNYYAYWWVHNTFVVVRNVLFMVAMILLGRPEASYVREDELTAHE